MGDVDPASCRAFGDQLAEVALGVGDPDQRVDLEWHLAACEACRAQLASLSTAADRLVLVVADAEPPPGFEGRVVRAIPSEAPVGGGVSTPRRRPAALVASGVVILLIAGGAAFALGSDRGSAPQTGPAGVTSPRAVRARLLSADGRPVGRISLSAVEPRSMDVRLSGVQPGLWYRCVVVLADGRREVVGSWRVEGPGDSWTVALPPRTFSARRVEVSVVGGSTVAVANLGD